MRPKKTETLQDWQKPLRGCNPYFMFVDEATGNVWRKPSDIFTFEPWGSDPNPPT
jgi:hypothetical protein